MSPSERALHERVLRQAAGMEPNAKARLLTAYDTIRAALTDAEVMRASRDGSLERLVQAVAGDRVLDPAFAPLRALIDQVALQAGASWTRFLPQRVTPPVFDLLNPRILEAVRVLDTRVIQGIKEEVRDTVRQAAEVGLREGVGPRAVARGIREAVGLAPNQEEAVRNFRRMLEAGDREALTRKLRDRRFDRTLAKALGKGGKGLSPEQIDRMTEAYRTRAIAHNAETHARTIALDTQRLAQRSSWESAIAQGAVDRNRLLRQWIDTGDSRVRPEHADLGKSEPVPFDTPYANGEMIPGENDYNCRCVERIILLPAVKAAA